VTKWIIVAAVVAVLGVRLARWRWRVSHATAHSPRRSLDLHGAPLVASREIKERVRGRPFLIGTTFILLAVAAAIVIPVLDHSPPAPVRVGVVGQITSELRDAVTAIGKDQGIVIHIAPEPTATAARRALLTGRIDFAIQNGRSIEVATAITPSDDSNAALVVESLAYALGVQTAYRDAGLTRHQINALGAAKPLPIHGLRPGAPNRNTGTSVIGVILIFVMLSQYNAWILLGVLEEKTSRVVEVLLAAVRPIQLLAGKILGIGIVALGQATLIVGFALVLAKLVGSDLLRGTAPVEIACALLWLVLGFAFYSWAYAAAASLAQRQDQVQSLALPLSVPLLLGYVMSLTVASSGSPSAFFDVLAYLPPTAPFAMTVLVGIGHVHPWQFCASVAISILGTVGIARIASTIYRRSILRTGGRVKLREVLTST
jgi:ABC-2 type transport system permease protein